jgi:hypothetical protein
MRKAVRARRANADATPVCERRRGTRAKSAARGGPQVEAVIPIPSPALTAEGRPPMRGLSLANRRHTLCSHLCHVALYVAACFRLCRR